MAGTIFGLGLQQRVDTNGNPDAGWLLYLYEANSSTPVTAYKDTALTAGLEHPWPIEADSTGMMPSFWLADGSYRARATSNDGSRTFFDLGSVLALGASSGSAPSGGVDANAIFQTGDTMFQAVAGTRAGWVRDNARTIGSSTSGATERANADCQALFEFYWNTYSDTQCPVAGGRGANALADWNANKQIQTLDLRGVSPIGLDDMGNSAASRFTGVPFASGDAITAASICGEATHTLTSSEVPATAVTGSGRVTMNSGSDSPLAVDSSSAVASGFQSGGSGTVYEISKFSTLDNVSITGSVSGGGNPHSNVQRSITGTWYRKL
jgi:hypothetical protein